MKTGMKGGAGGTDVEGERETEGKRQMDAGMKRREERERERAY